MSPWDACEWQDACTTHNAWIHEPTGIHARGRRHARHACLAIPAGCSPTSARPLTVALALALTLSLSLYLTLYLTLSLTLSLTLALTLALTLSQSSDLRLLSCSIAASFAALFASSCA